MFLPEKIPTPIDNMGLTTKNSKKQTAIPPSPFTKVIAHQGSSNIMKADINMQKIFFLTINILPNLKSSSMFVSDFIIFEKYEQFNHRERGINHYVLQPRSDRPGKSSRPCFFPESQGEPRQETGTSFPENVQGMAGDACQIGPLAGGEVVIQI